MTPAPSITFILELSFEELIRLWAILTFLDASGNLESDEQPICAKVQRLLEGS